MSDKIKKKKKIDKEKSDNILPVTAIRPRFNFVSSTVNAKYTKENIEKYKSLLLLDGFVDVQIPNEIFNDLFNCTLFKNWHQRAFAYTFYYLNSFLYRNCIHCKSDKINSFGLSNLCKIFMDVSSTTLSCIYTKGGILDQLGYTATTHDPPVEIIIEDKKLKQILTVNDAHHLHQSDKDNLSTFNSYCSIPSAFLIKVPLKGLYNKPPINYEELNKKKYKNTATKKKLNTFDGHFFDFSNTHKIEIECFIACMSNPLLGYRAFYLYGLHRLMTDKFKNGHNMLIKQLNAKIPMSKKSMQQYHRELEAMNLIQRKIIVHKATTYTALSHVPIIKI